MHKLALIIRAADTDRFDLAPQAAGLWAISAGLSNTNKDDQQVLKFGFVLYDSLYYWCKYLLQEKYIWNPALQTLCFLLNIIL